MTDSSAETDLADAIADLYQGPFEDFVSRRDALVKQLRAEKRKDDATLVKALRKPTRMASVIDRVVGEDPAAIDRLSTAIAKAQAAADLRGALETVKEAVRGVAAVAARIAVRDGHPIEPNAIAAAVHAIIGDATAFEEFRAGRLVDVPEGGGLDMLIALKPNASSTPTKKAAPKPAPRAAEREKEDPRVALAASARAELHRAEKTLAGAREKLKDATVELRDTKASLKTAEADLEAAEHAVRRALSELEARRKEVERAQRRVDAATGDVDDAQRDVDKARARVSEFE